MCWLSISQKLWQVSAKIMFVQTLYKNLGAIEHRQFELSITTTCISVQYQLYLRQRWQPAKFKTFPSEIFYDPSSAVHIYDYLISIRIWGVMLFYLASMVSEIGKFWSTANIFNLKGTSICKTKMQIGCCWKPCLQCGFVFNKSTKQTTNLN